MSHFMFLLITLGWIYIAWRAINTSAIKDLRVETILLGLGWSGFNVVFGLLVLFDFLESTPSDFILNLLSQKGLVFSFTLCLCNIGSGLHLVVRLLLSAKTS